MFQPLPLAPVLSSKRPETQRQVDDGKELGRLSITEERRLSLQSLQIGWSVAIRASLVSFDRIWAVVLVSEHG
jgi:hypothetical protein